MKKYLVQLLYFSILPLVLVIILELLITLFHDDIFSEKRLEKLFLNEVSEYGWIDSLKTDSINVLAGSSTVKYALSCSQLNNLNPDSSYYVNIAADARDPIVTYFIIKSLDPKQITTLYMGLDPWIYSKKYYNYRNNFFYLDFNIFQAIYFSYEFDQSAFLQRYKLFLSLLFDDDSQVSAKKSEVPIDFGSGALTKIPKNFKNDPHKLFRIETYGWSDLQFIYLKKIIDYCQTNKIPFSMIVPPKRSDFIHLYQKDCSEIHKVYLQHLTDKGIKGTIIGTFDQHGMDGDSIYFVDGLHLIQRGQKKYSEIFYQLTQSSLPPAQKQYDWYTN